MNRVGLLHKKFLEICVIRQFFLKRFFPVEKSMQI